MSTLHPKFPPVPNVLLEPCQDLTLANNDERLSELMFIVTNNYTQYYQCQSKVDSWIIWYNENKKLIEDLK